MSKKCICGRDMVLKEWKHQWVCTRCGKTKPVAEVTTNADHIRSMTDEELAMDIMHLNFCPPNIDEYKECGANANCHQCWVDWLKQPYGGDT